jgi:hypothetical protein
MWRLWSGLQTVCNRNFVCRTSTEQYAAKNDKEELLMPIIRERDPDLVYTRAERENHWAAFLVAMLLILALGALAFFMLSQNNERAALMNQLDALRMQQQNSTPVTQPMPIPVPVPQTVTVPQPVPVTVPVPTFGGGSSSSNSSPAPAPAPSHSSSGTTGSGSSSSTTSGSTDSSSSTDSLGGTSDTGSSSDTSTTP